MTLGDLIGLIALAAFLLTGWAIFSVGGKTEDDEIVERRLRAVNPLPPEHPGEVVPFKRRAP